MEIMKNVTHCHGTVIFFKRFYLACTDCFKRSISWINILYWIFLNKYNLHGNYLFVGFWRFVHLMGSATLLEHSHVIGL